MSLKIIGAGFGRTGTASVQEALNELGYPCYHMFEVLGGGKQHLDFWLEVARGKPGQQFDWEKVLAGYTASVDNPGCCVWEELLAAYPDARVLLTVHPKGPRAWYTSTMNTIYFTQRMWQFKVLRLFTPFGRKFAEMTNKLIWQRSHKNTMEDRTRAIAHYRQHIKDVMAKVPPEKLLIYSVDQGWEPLCKFLGVPVPQTPFPNVNDRESFRQTIKNITRGAYFILGGIALIAAALIYGLILLLG